MYYFYAPEMFVPFHWGLERNVSYAYMPYHSFYYGNYIDAVPYVLNVPQNDQVKVKEENRGSWTPFSWVEKYAYAFSGPYNKAEVALTFDDGPDLVFTPKILDKLKQYNVKATFSCLVKMQKSFRM